MTSSSNETDLPEGKASMYGRVHAVRKGLAEIMVVCEDEALKGPHCGFCSASGGASGKAKNETILARNDAGATAGTIVELSIDEHAELKAALILFVIPLTTFILALIAAAAIQLPLLQAAGTGGAVLLLTLVVLKAVLRNKTYHRVVRVVPKPLKRG